MFIYGTRHVSFMLEEKFANRNIGTSTRSILSSFDTNFVRKSFGVKNGWGISKIQFFNQIWGLKKLQNIKKQKNGTVLNL